MRDIDNKKQTLLDMHWIVKNGEIQGKDIAIEFNRYAGKPFITKIVQIGFSGISERFFDSVLQDVLKHRSGFLELANFKQDMEKAELNKVEYMRNLCKKEVKS